MKTFLTCLIVAGFAFACHGVAMETNRVTNISRSQIEKAWYAVKHPTNQVERAEGLKLIAQAADEKNARAQTLMGICNETGLGMATNLQNACVWYQRAIEGDQIDAIARLGYLTETFKHDITNAVALYKRAAESGHARSQLNLANCFRSGNGVEQDNGEALSWYAKAAAGGDLEGLYTLAVCLYRGLLEVTDRPRAMRLFHEAARRNHKKSIDALKKMGYEFDGDALKITSKQAEEVLNLEMVFGEFDANLPDDFLSDDVFSEETFLAQMDEKESNDGAAIKLSKRILKFMQENKFNYSFNPTGETYHSTFVINGKIGKAEFVLQSRPTCAICYIVLPIRAPEGLRDEMAKLIARINPNEGEQSFQMDFDDGEIRLKTTASAEALLAGDDDRVRRLLTDGLPVLENYFDAILAVSLGLKTAQEACEGE